MALADELKMLQHHPHTKTCRKRKKVHCRFNFPQLPMKSTRILRTLKYDNDKTKENEKLIFETIKYSKYNNTYTFYVFFNYLGLTQEYIHPIQCSLNRTIILLQRTSNIWINSFARHIPKIWNANTDSQFIVDLYAKMTYYSKQLVDFDLYAYEKNMKN
jgi:hypothetical protein